MKYISVVATLEDLLFAEGSCRGNNEVQSNPYFNHLSVIDKKAFEGLTFPEGITLGNWTYKGGSFVTVDDVMEEESLSLCQQIVDLTNEAASINNMMLLRELAAQKVPEWYKQTDIDLLAKRLEEEFGVTIVRMEGATIAIYNNQAWNIASDEQGHFTVEQGCYDYRYFPKMGKNLAQRLSFLTLRQSLQLSRETVKSYLYKSATKLSFKEVGIWFEEWLGGSSWKSGYWKHHDINTEEVRISVIANHAKDMLVITCNDGVHIFSGKDHILVEKLPRLFYKFAKVSLVDGKDYSWSGTGYSLRW